MLGLDELVELHKNDQPGKPLFTAYVSAVPVHRVRAGLLVVEAVELDPVDLFLLEGIQAGLRSPRELALFFGLEQEVVDDSIGEMLHNDWVASTAPQPGQLVLALQAKGREALTDKRAPVDAEHDAELWVDGLLGTCEVRPPRQRLLRPIDTKQQAMHRLPAIVHAPRQSADLDFKQLERSVARQGSQLWPGVQLALLLDVLSVARRGTGYRPIEVLVFQDEQGTQVDFQVYDGGARHDDYERALRRLELSESRSVVPTETPPPAAELAAFQKHRAHVLSLASTPRVGATEPSTNGTDSKSATDAAQGGGAPMPPIASDTATPKVDTRERLRGELAAAQAALREQEVLAEEQGKIIGQQALFRNHENRIAWKRVLLHEAQRYVVMEFPWITREAIDAEMVQCFEEALQRRVKLWIAWGLDEKGRAGGRVADQAVLRDITDLQKRHGVRSIRMQHRGNTHRKVLLWDGRAAIIGSFNWGSFRGDPRMPVREEIGAQVMSPREVSNLEAEYRKIFSITSLA